MWQDPIISEIRQIREAHGAEFNYNLRAIYVTLKKVEQESKRKKVTFSPKRITPVPTKKAKPALSG